MTPNNPFEIIQNLYGFKVDDEVKEKFFLWEKLFVEYNLQTNLMSKNDINVLFEKHVLDCLSIKFFKGFKQGVKIVDIGAGGGFPSLIISIFFPCTNVIALDSVKKKTDFLNLAKSKLELDNFSVINNRAENEAPLNADIITNRAVGKIGNIWKISKQHLKKNGYFVSYKALTAEDEAKEAQKNNKELKNLIFIPYELPLKERHTRKLVIFQNC